MGEQDPFDTQRCPLSLAVELGNAGFSDVQEIGRGGFGVVYRCTQAELSRTVAVKVLSLELNEDNQERFFREQQAMGRLSGHPNIVNILQVGATGSGFPYMVMHYCPQDSLELRIRSQGPLPLGQVLRLGVKMAGAVETAHRLGIMHRDVKPSNILLTDYGEPELTDFGIAHVAGGFETDTGVVTGSPAYTAPEILAGDPSSPAADVYGLGSTLFSALTGHAAFERRSGEQVVAQFVRITTQPVPDLREQGMPDDVSGVIAGAMARTPDDRPSTAAAFGEKLQQLQRNHDLQVDNMALLAESELWSTVEVSTSRSRRPQALQTLGPTGRFPLELNSFVDRREALTETRNLLAGSRLVTLTGIGGVGKTRLAMRVAAAVQREYDDGAVLVELGELRDSSALVDAVATAAGVPDYSARPRLQVLTQFLISRELLLVLDNCEHAVDVVAELASLLLRSCPKLQILATSREALAIDGEAVLRVPPLALPDPSHQPTLRNLPKHGAVTLFVERAAASIPGFTLTDDNAAAVTGICLHLDGLPLSIELAAARLRAMSPEQILGRLTDRFSLLSYGRRGVPTRQQTLRLSVDWSFELCTTSEKLAWGRLSVFAGSFELDAAEQVCGAHLVEGELLGTLTSLVEKSILIREEDSAVVRFRMLETLREYGKEKLEQSGEDITVRRLHRRWYETLVRDADVEWISARQLDWISRLRREQPNLREALGFSIDDDPAAGLRIASSLYVFWVSQGLHSEGRRWLDELLKRHRGPASVELLKAQQRACYLATMQGDLQAGAVLVTEAQSLVTHTSDTMMHSLVAYADGTLAFYSGDLERASSRLEIALAGFGECGDQTLDVATRFLLGLAYELRGLSQSAIECLQQVIAITEQHGEKMYRSHALWALGIVAWRQGGNARAIRLVEQSLELARQVRNPRAAIACLAILALIAAEQPDSQRVAILLGAADALAAPRGIAVVQPILIGYRQDCERKSRRELGDKLFESGHRKGAKLGLEEAIAYALHERSPDLSRADGKSMCLTKREHEVALLIAEGLTNRAIAKRLVIAPRTAQGHVEHILTKLGYTSRTQVATWIMEHQND